ncbi:phospholipase, partial [Flavobacteriaceae bacterium]|nr:phospholipase [Flavobacteriaceae bacterium]
DINLLGFSQGAILSYAAAMSHGHLSKVICLSGYINEELLPDNTTLNSCKETRFFASHGDQDQVIPVAWARNSSTRLKELGCNLEYHEFPAGHGVSPENFAALNSFLNG